MKSQEITTHMPGVCETKKKCCQDTLRTVFRYDLVSGSEITYDHLTDGIMWAQGLFSDSVKIMVLAPFNTASWSFSEHSF